MKNGFMFNYDNAVIHDYPASPYIVKTLINVREGKRIRFDAALKNLEIARKYLEEHFPGIPVKVITHNIDVEA